MRRMSLSARDGNDSACPEERDAEDATPLGPSDDWVWVRGRGAVHVARHDRHRRWHAHHAFQLTFPLHETVRLEVAGLTEGRRLVPPGRRHRVVGAGPSVSFYWDAESELGRRMRTLEADSESLGRRVASVEDELFDSARTLESLYERTTAVLFQDVDPYRFDERVERMLVALRRAAERAPSLEELARLACLSPSRARRLFREQVGTTVSRYRRTMKSIDAMTRIYAGQSATRAAVDAGFSDGAHLSRTHREYWSLRVTDFAAMRRGHSEVVDFAGFSTS